MRLPRLRDLSEIAVGLVFIALIVLGSLLLVVIGALALQIFLGLVVVFGLIALVVDIAKEAVKPFRKRRKCNGSHGPLQ